jgi:hypothetical protein
VLIVVAGATFLWLRSRSPIGAGCDRIERGMSQVDVEKIFGGQGVDIQLPPDAKKMWIGSDGAAFVDFDNNRKVKDVQFAPAIQRESFLAMVRRWLRL